jgi:hypothetical protein
MTRYVRVLWVLLCLLAGAPCAFLALEFIGIPLTALVLAAIIIAGRRRGTLAEMLIAFAATYSIEIYRYAIPDVATFWQQNELPNTIFFAAHIVVATGMLGAAAWLFLRARRSAPAPS